MILGNNLKRSGMGTVAVAFLLAVSLAVSLAGMSGVGRAAAQQAELPPSLPNGIAAGDVTPTSVVLWARSTAHGPGGLHESIHHERNPSRPAPLRSRPAGL